MGDMTGQVALVTGGIRGIGRAISERLFARGVEVCAGYSHGKEAAEKFAADLRGLLRRLVAHGDVQGIRCRRLGEQRPLQGL